MPLTGRKKKCKMQRHYGGHIMNFLSILLIAVGLAMDAFAVSVSTGMSVCDFRWTHNLRMSALFGIFQAGMPVIGFYCATKFSRYIENADHWVAFVLLAVIGGKMLWEAFASKEEPAFQGAADCPVPPENPQEVKKGSMASDVLTLRRMLVLAVATSIDALAVGVSFAFLHTGIWLPAFWIGIVCFAFSFTGGVLGRRIGPILGKTAEIAGGIILVGIGVKILLDHLFFS